MLCYSRVAFHLKNGLIKQHSKKSRSTLLFLKRGFFFVAESHAMCNQWIELVDHHRGWTSSTSSCARVLQRQSYCKEERASPSSQATKPLPLFKLQQHREFGRPAWGQQFQQLLNLLRHGDSHVVQKIFQISASGGWSWDGGTHRFSLGRTRPLGQRRIE